MGIEVLGPLRVEVGGRPIRLAGPVQRRLLAALVAHAPGMVPVDVLVDDVWGETPPATAVRTLHSHVARLRDALGRGSGPEIETVDGGYRLAVDPEDVDAWVFEELVRSAHDDGLRADAVAGRLHQALDLWRGPAYADVRGAEFADGEAGRLEALRETALEERVEADLEAGLGPELVPELESLVARHPFRERLWAALMVALYRDGRQAEALEAYRQAREVLGDELGVDPGPELRRAESMVLAQDPGLDRPRVAASRPTCPWKGLAAYQQADAEFFVGREHVVSQVVARLVDRPLVVVTGESGAGKSSLVRAGVVPALAAGAVLGSEGWSVRVVVGGHGWAEASADRLDLLVVDQAEELFAAPDHDPAEVGSAIRAVVERGGRVLLVLRGDAYGRLATLPGLASALASGTVLVGPPDRDELGRIVVEPARRVGLAVDPGLVEAAVSDVVDRPAALPLLSTALVRTWERHRGDRLTLADYRDSGGAARALERLAEDALASLDDDQRRAARRILMRLVTYDRGRWSSSRQPLSAVVPEEGDANALAAWQALQSYRLVAVGRDEAQLAHEALLTEWPRMAKWLRDRATMAGVVSQLRVAASAWDEGGRDASDAYRGARLAAALDLEAEHPEELGPVETAFLAASRAESERARRRSRRQTRRLQSAVVLLAILLIGLTVAASFAAVRGRQARDAGRVADARRLGLLALTTDDRTRSLLAAVAAVSLDRTPATESNLLAALERTDLPTRTVGVTTVPADLSVSPSGLLAVADDDAIVRVFDEAGHRLVEGDPELMWESGAAVPAIDWVDDLYLLVGAADPPRVFRVNVRNQAASLLAADWDPMTTTVVDEGRLAVGLGPAGDRDATLHVVNVSTGEDRRLPLGLVPERVVGGPDSRVLVVDAGGRAAVVDPALGRVVARTRIGPDAVVSLSPDGRWLALADPGSPAVRLVPVGPDDPGRSAVDLLGLTGVARDLSFSPDGRLVAAIDGADGSVRLWEAPTGLPVARVGRAVGAWTWSSDGGALLTAPKGTVGRVDIWDATRVVNVARSVLGHGPADVGSVRSVGIDETGRTLAVGTADGRVWTLDLESGVTRVLPRRESTAPVLSDLVHADATRPIGQMSAGTPALVISVAFADGGRVLLTADSTGVLTRWDVTTGAPLGDVTGPTTPVNVPLDAHAVVGPDDRTAASFANGFDVSLVDVATGRVVRYVLPQLGDQTYQVRQVLGWAGDSSLIIRTAGAFVPGIWARVSAVTGQVEWSVDAPEDIGAPQAVLVDGVPVVLGESGTPHFLDVASGERATADPTDTDEGLNNARLRTWHPGGLVLSPDGGTLAAVSPAGAVTLWDTASRQARGTLASTGITTAVYRPNGGLVTVSTDGAVWVYDLDPDTLLADACARAGRDMTLAEWESLVPEQPYRSICPQGDRAGG